MNTQENSIAQPSHRRVTEHVARPLIFSFIALAGLMLLLVWQSASHMQDLNGRMREIVEHRNQKIQLATDLLEFAHNRHNALVYQTVTQDPFARDEIFQQYLKWGYEVGKARSSLRAMDLDSTETANLLRQDELVGQVIHLQERISDLSAEERFADAQDLLANQLRSLNIQMIEEINRLRQHERDSIQHLLNEASAMSHSAIRIYAVLGILMLGIAAGLGVWVQRRLNRGALIISQQLEDLEAVGDRLAHEATHDPLTGLANRSLFYRRLSQAMEHAEEEHLNLSVLYIDLDKFKPVNDEYGHAAGDTLLQILAGRLLKSVRNTDTIARLGGDEFAMILLGVGEPQQLNYVIEKITTDVAQPADIGPVTLTPGCSIGYAVYPVDGEETEDLLHAADQRMYEVKRQAKLAAKDSSRH